MTALHRDPNNPISGHDGPEPATRAASPCPDEGWWRAWLDQAVDAREAVLLEAHLTQDCPRCDRTLADLRTEAAFAAATIPTLEPVAHDASVADVERAWQRLAWRRQAAVRAAPALASTRLTPISPPPVLTEKAGAMSTTSAPSRTREPSAWSRWRVTLSGLAAALALTFVFGFTPQGQQVASAFLAQFRAEKIQVVPVDATQLRNMDKLAAQMDHLGTVQMPPGLSSGSAMGEGAAHGSPATQSVTLNSLEEASTRLGFPVRAPSALPQGVAATPSHIQYLPGNEARFTFSVAKARAYFQSINRPDVQLPAKFDGAALVVNTPPAVLVMYPGPAAPAGAAKPASGTGSAEATLGNMPGLVYGVAGQLTVNIEGGQNVTLDELRDFLLGLPGMPPEVAAQLRAIQDWRTTLPLPIPVDQVNWKQERVAGVEALVLDDKSGMGSGVLFQRDGHTYGVGGGYKSDDMKRAADSIPR